MGRVGDLWECKMYPSIRELTTTVLRVDGHRLITHSSLLMTHRKKWSFKATHHLWSLMGQRDGEMGRIEMKRWKHESLGLGFGHILKFRGLVEQIGKTRL